MIYDVARVAGVSTATVSRVLRGSDLVHPNTRQRVLAVIETLGFVPDASARGLTRRRKDIIGLVGLERGADEIDIERSATGMTALTRHLTQQHQCQRLCFDRVRRRARQPGHRSAADNGQPAVPRPRQPRHPPAARPDRPADAHPGSGGTAHPGRHPCQLRLPAAGTTVRARPVASPRKEILHAKAPDHEAVAGKQSMGGTERGRRAACQVAAA
jgi:hypothetical protein